MYNFSILIDIFVLTTKYEKQLNNWQNTTNHRVATIFVRTGFNKVQQLYFRPNNSCNDSFSFCVPDMSTSQLGGGATVQRHPTMPLSKRESLASNGSRVSLLTTGSVAFHHVTAPGDRGKQAGTAAPPKEWTDKDFLNNNPEMISGKKRGVTKKLKRTDSYKRALNRQSGNELSDLVKDTDNTTCGCDLTIARGAERKKYNTLPIKPNTSTSPKITDVLKRKPDNGHSKGAVDKGDFSRTASQRSGTYYPSPDTDDDQRSTRLDQRKKSKFVRMKERLIHTFRRHPDSDAKKDTKYKKVKTHAHKHKVKPRDHHINGNSKAFVTPNALEVEVTDITESTGATGKHEPQSSLYSTNSQRSVPDKQPGLLKRFRNSFRISKREYIPVYVMQISFIRFSFSIRSQAIELSFNSVNALSDFVYISRSTLS